MQPLPGAAPRAYSVTEITRRIREILEIEIDRVWIRGEISSWKVHPSSGHAYFCLKDEKAVLNCVAWATTVRAASRALRPRDGLRVRAFGRLTVYEPRGAYQLVVEEMLDEGEGELQAAFLRLKRKLEAEGLFDPGRKRPIPRMPRCIGVVTSSGGAALRDILKVLARRWPLAHVCLRPAPVQGPGAAQEIAAAIRELNGLRGIDVLIVGRGGGSLEDLWAFNEEVLARAVFASAVPVISAVGHEIDFTICDFTADARAATPTHAAEMATPDMEEVLQGLNRDRRLLRQGLRRALDGARLRVQRAGMSGGLRRPEDLLRTGRLDLDRLADRLRVSLSGRSDRGRVRYARLERRLLRADPTARLAALRKHVADRGRASAQSTEETLRRARGRVALASARLNALGPEQVLARGYGIVVRAADGAILRSASGVATGEEVRVRLHRGRLECRVERSEPGGAFWSGVDSDRKDAGAEERPGPGNGGAPGGDAKEGT